MQLQGRGPILGVWRRAIAISAMLAAATSASAQGVGSIEGRVLSASSGEPVYLTRSTDGGHTFAPNRRVSIGEVCPCCRTALVSGTDGSLYIAWRTVLPGNIRDIVVARSTDGGATWSAARRVHADDWVFEACPHAGPALAVDSSGDHDEADVPLPRGRRPDAGDRLFQP